MKITNFTQRAVRHGEVILIPIDTLPDGLEIDIADAKDFIIGHSETGHHHILTGGNVTVFKLLSPEANGTMYKTVCKQLYGKDESTWPSELVPFEAKSDMRIEHKKSFDVHEVKPVAKGLYFKVGKTEHDYFAKVRRQVMD